MRAINQPAPKRRPGNRNRTGRLNRGQDKAGVKPTRDRIRDAAIALFARKGYDGVSVRDITRAVGIKESSLYNHYRSKKDLLAAVFEYFRKQMAQEGLPDAMIENRLEALGPVEFMKRGVSRFIEHWDDPGREMSWLVVSMEQYKNRKAAEIILKETERIVAYTERIFRNMIVRKDIAPHDPRMLAVGYAYALRAMHLEYELLKTFRLDTRKIRKRMSEFVDFTLSLLKPDRQGRFKHKLRKKYRRETGRTKNGLA